MISLIALTSAALAFASGESDEPPKEDPDAKWWDALKGTKQGLFAMVGEPPQKDKHRIKTWDLTAGHPQGWTSVKGGKDALYALLWQYQHPESTSPPRSETLELTLRHGQLLVTIEFNGSNVEFQGKMLPRDADAYMRQNIYLEDVEHNCEERWNDIERALEKHIADSYQSGPYWGQEDVLADVQERLDRKGWADYGPDFDNFDEMMDLIEDKINEIIDKGEDEETNIEFEVERLSDETYPQYAYEDCEEEDEDEDEDEDNEDYGG